MFFWNFAMRLSISVLVYDIRLISKNILVMKKITYLMAVLFASLWSVVSAQNYDPWYSGNYTRPDNDRKLNSVTFTSPMHGAQTATAGTKTYTDLTSTKTLYAEPGETVSVSFNYTGTWMNGYVYIDTDKDGFTAGVNTSTHAPTGDLMTYSFYGGSDTYETSGYNSAGSFLSGDNRNTLNCPSFTCPSTPGTYRMRFKVDWNSIDPAGDSNDTHGNFKGNGGAILDVMLEVKAPAANTFDITYVYKLNGTQLYSTTNTYAEGAAFPDHDAIPSYMDVTVSPERTSTVTASGTYEVNTTLKSDSPFKFSSSLNDPQWVTMKLLFSKNGNRDGEAKRYDEGTWVGANGAATKLDYNNPTAENFANYMWAFVGDWYNGYKVYTYADQSMKLAYTGNFTTNLEKNRTVVMSTTEDAAQSTWKLEEWVGTDGVGYTNPTYSLRLVSASHPNYYAGDHIANRVLGTWESATGNSVNHGRIAFADPLPIYKPYAQTVLAEAGKVGYPKTTSGGATQLESALTSATNFSDLYGYVENFRSESDVVLPTDGKAYILKAHFTGSDKYVALGSEALTTSETEGATFICHQLDNGKFVFVNNNGTFFNKVGNFTAYSNWTEFTLLHSYGDVAQTYGTFGMQAHDYKYLTVNGTSFQQGNEGIAETSTTAFYLEETTYANNPAMTTAKGIDEEKKIATFSAPFAFTLPAGIDAYIVKQTKTDGTASLTKLASEGEVVAANTGVILLGTTAESNVLMIPATTTGATDAESMLGNTAGAPKDIVSAGNNYILAMNGVGNIIFSKASAGATNGNNLAMNKAYLTVPGGSANQFKIDFGGTTTAIETIATEGNNNSSAVYDLSGRRVSTPAHRGIYIRNGKKFMVK